MPWHGPKPGKSFFFLLISTIWAELLFILNFHFSLYFFFLIYVSNIFANCACHVREEHSLSLLQIHLIDALISVKFWVLIFPPRVFVLSVCQFFEYSTDNEIRYNTREPAGCAVADPISTFLMVNLCRKPHQPVPEDQKFVLREVRHESLTISSVA